MHFDAGDLSCLRASEMFLFYFLLLVAVVFELRVKLPKQLLYDFSHTTTPLLF
jgi:hypothetical protein